MHAYISNIPLHAAKIAPEAMHARSLSFVDDIVAAREEDEAGVEDSSEVPNSTNPPSKSLRAYSSHIMNKRMCGCLYWLACLCLGRGFRYYW